MDLQVFQAVGGLGLFLVGMRMMTEALRALAGGTLRRLLRRSTRSTLGGVMTGAGATAMVQSSSATTVAVVGFVGAGLMTFQQGLGVIFGANVGTTITGWLVAIIGFKLQLADWLAPFVLVGALIGMFAGGRWKHVGWAIAGFALLFVGISAMQDGLVFLRDIVAPSDFPADTLAGRLQLVGIGIAITLVTQSSSAGVAAALAALGTGAISFPQAAALVIGMDVGTTVTAALATIGGSVAARRAGYAHVIYNVLTALMAFVLLEPLVWLIDASGLVNAASDPQIALVAFHTSFNFLGVVSIIGVTGRFGRLVVRLVRERGPKLAARLDDRLLADPAAAIDAVAATTRQMGDALFAVLADQLAGEEGPSIERRLASLDAAEEETRQFAEHIRSSRDQAVVHRRHLAVIHVLDHQGRLHQRCAQYQRIEAIAGDPVLSELAGRLSAEVRSCLEHGPGAECERRIDDLRATLGAERHSYRDAAIARASLGEVDIPDVTLKLDAVRWLYRVSYHIWRIVHHQRIAESDELPAARDREPEIEALED